MAFCVLRLRRVLSLSSSIIKHQRSFSAIPAISASPSLFSATLCSQNPSSDLALSHFNYSQFQFRGFRSSTASLSPPRYNDNNKNDEIGPDTILFEGCDYNHWLITMDFPKDPKPTPEEMVETYVQTLAKVVGSVEEAKKRMYACSTTTYTGFQAVMTEEMSEKFKGLPGVVFILPDSYIDPVNKEYGGDKYINGTIIPRPPPVRYGGQGGRYGDQNRGFNRQPRGQTPYQQGQSTYDNQGPMQGNPRNYRAPQNSPPQQNYGPPQNFPPQQNYGPPQSSPLQHNYGSPQSSPPQQSYRPTQSYPPQQNYGPPQNSQPQQNYGAAGTGEIGGPLPINNAPGGREVYQGERRDQMPSHQANYNQGERGNYYPQGQRDFPPGNQRNYMPTDQRDSRGDNRNFAPIQGGPYGQGADGTHVQGVGANPGRDMDAGYGQSYPGHGGHQRFPQMEQQNNMEGEGGSYATMGHRGMDQGKY